MLTIFLSLLMTLTHWLGHPPAPKTVYALTNARLVTVSQGVIENGTLIIKDGKIAALGKAITVPQGAEVIDCSGKSIYPGFIEGGSRVGLTEVGSLPETNDYDELGNITPQMQALTAINPNSELIPVTRVNGITTSLALPAGGLFPGTAALINLHGYTPQQMFAGFKGAVLNFPSTARGGDWDRRSDEEIERTYQKALEELNNFWQQVVEYQRISAAYKSGQRTPEYAPELQALVPVIQKEMPLLIEVNAAKDIVAALTWVKAKGVKVILMGVAEGWRVADQIAAANIPVITGPVLTTPTRESDRYDRAYANAGLMLKAGVKVALRTMANENSRNLPYHAGFAAAYGMGRDQALRAVTLTAAEIFGVSNRLGSLDVGKDATFFVTDGDPFETKTQVHYLFIGGYKVPLTSRQTDLYQEFLRRSPGLEK